jgi:hypothetical protein
MKTMTVRYSSEFVDTIDVDDDWEWDGSLDQICPDLTDLPFNNPTMLLDWDVEA